MLLTQIPIPAHAFDSGKVYLSFEAVDGGRINNQRMPDIKFDAGGFEKTDGARGNGMRIGYGGYLNAENGKIGKMLSKSTEISLSAYVRNNAKKSGELFNIRFDGSKSGIAITKSNSVITVSVRSDKNETFRNVSCDTGESFDDWTHILTNISFKNGSIELYVNGICMISETVKFMSDEFAFYGSSVPDLLGDEGLDIDEVRIGCGIMKADDIQYMLEYDRENEPEEEEYMDILKDNLIAHFPFNEGEGDTVHSNGAVAVEGKAQTELDWGKGVHGTAVKFHSEKKNWINIGQDVKKALSGAEGMTVSCWIYLNDEPGSSYTNRILSLNIDGERAMLHLSYTSGKIILAAARSQKDGALTGRNYKLSFDWGKWMFLTLTADLKENTMRLFIDGEEMTPMQDNGSIKTAFSTSVFEISDTANDDTIGGDPTNPRYSMTFNGMIDELKIYNRAITTEEAQYIYVKNSEPDEVELDTERYVKLNEISKNTVIFTPGFNEVMYDGKRVRIDWSDFDSKPVIVNDTTMVPLKFVTDILGTTAEFDAAEGRAEIAAKGNSFVFVAGDRVCSLNGRKVELAEAPFVSENGKMYIPLRLIAEQTNKYVMFKNDIIAVGDKAAIQSFEEDDEFVLWLRGALCNLPYAPATAHHSETRSVVKYQPAETKIYPASPSIVKMDDGTIVVSHDTALGTTVYNSYDDGKTWEEVWNTDQMVYGNLFRIGDALYIMGVSRGSAPAPNPRIVLRRSLDGGKTWTQPTTTETGILNDITEQVNVLPAHTAPMPVVFCNNRIYRAFEISGSGWRSFRVVVLSADLNSDLLCSKSWTFTNTVSLTDNLDKLPDEINGSDLGLLETNMVIGTDGKVRAVSRLNSAPSVDWAGVMTVSDDNTKLEFEKAIKFPGGMTKFTIRRDEQTGKYISLVNPNTDPDYTVERSTLALSVSDDCYNWELKETLLYPEWLENRVKLLTGHAFQYVDWIFDGDDILYVVREAGIGANNYHNSNYITFYRLKDFRRYLN